MSQLYQGPVIDPHHHLWDLTMGRHPWLAPKPDDAMVFGSIAAIRRNYVPEDYLQDVTGQNIVATVHIEAGWDDGFLPEETEWLDGLAKESGVAQRYVSRVNLMDHDAEEKIALQAANTGTVLNFV